MTNEEFKKFWDEQSKNAFIAFEIKASKFKNPKFNRNYKPYILKGIPQSQKSDGK